MGNMDCDVRVLGLQKTQIEQVTDKNKWNQSWVRAFEFRVVSEEDEENRTEDKERKETLLATV